jgi:hypothetical protein
MERTLDYARPAERRPRSDGLARLATATLFLPLLVAATLYGEWLLAWASLGHRPVPSLDDPKYIDSSTWLHTVTGLMLVSAMPMAFVGLALNLTHGIVNRLPWPRFVLRIVVPLVLWGTLFAVLRADPGDVVYWWLD